MITRDRNRPEHRPTMHGVAIRRLCSAGAVLLCVSGGFAAEYTLDDVLEAAYRNSEALKVSEEKLTKAREQIREAKGGALPTLEASAQYSHAFEQYIPFGGGDGGLGFGTGGGSLVDTVMRSGGDQADALIAGTLDGIISSFSDIDFTPPANSINLGLTLQQPLYAQGKVGLGLKIARTYREGLEEGHEQTRDSVAAGVSKLFYAALLGAKNVEIRKRGLELSRESHRLSVVRAAAGTASAIDTLSSRLALEKARVELRSARTDYRMAKEALLTQTGIDDNAEEMHLAGDIPEPDFEIEEERALTVLRDENRTLKQLERTLELQEHLVTLARTDFYPMVYCGGSLSRISSFDTRRELGNPAYWYYDSRVFVGLNLTLFKGTQRFRKVAQARSDYRSFSHTKQQAEKGLALAVKGLAEKLQTKKEELRSTRGILALAEKGYRISKRAYEVGSRTLLELQKAELELNSARMALAAAQYQYYSTVVDLKMLMGTFGEGSRGE